ncbi:MAG TPA: hypothetical protein VGF59_21045 [Bryobacteraceae bacterium]|jgi:two-component system chemotaxis response regulator CheB
MENKENIDATCPECRGPLSEVSIGDHREYRCLVGHVYSARSVLEGHSEAQEAALWAAVVALEEAGTLVECVAAEFPQDVARHLREQAEKKKQQALTLRGILEELEPFQLE